MNNTTKLKHFTFVLLFLGLFTQTTIAQANTNEEQTYEETLQEYLDISGANPVNNPILDQSLDNMDNLPDEYKNSVKSMAEKMMKRLAPIYKKHLSKETLEELIQFYKTPLGQELVEANKKIAIEINCHKPRIVHGNDARDDENRKSKQGQISLNILLG